MKEVKERRNHSKILYWSLMAVLMALMCSMQLVFAAETVTIWDKFSSIMRDFYLKLVGISTIIAVVMTTIAMIIRMTSRNQKAVEESTAWIKRILISWFILNMLGFIVAYIQPLVSGGTYTW